MAEDKFPVEVTYALPDEQPVVVVKVGQGATVEYAVNKSGLVAKYPEIDLQTNKVGIFGKLTKLNQKLRENDRVEIYRPLLADPKEVRRLRAAEGKTTRRGAKEINEGKGS